MKTTNESTCAALTFNFDFSSKILELEQELADKRNEESAIDARIERILTLNSDLPRSFNLAIARLKSRLTLIESDAGQLCNCLQLVSVLAENVSGKVCANVHVYILLYRCVNWTLPKDMWSIVCN
jgi:hypothetical protein